MMIDVMVIGDGCWRLLTVSASDLGFFLVGPSECFQIPAKIGRVCQQAFQFFFRFDAIYLRLRGFLRYLM